MRKPHLLRPFEIYGRHVEDVDCCGCLIVRTREDLADFVCNECGAVIRTVPLGDLEAAMLELAQTDTVCSAQCPHCGALNIFPGMSAITAFRGNRSGCSEAGEKEDSRNYRGRKAAKG